MKVPFFPPVCECGANFIYMKADAPAGYLFSCPNEKCMWHGMQGEVPLVEVKTHVTAALLRPKLKVV